LKANLPIYDVRKHGSKTEIKEKNIQHQNLGKSKSETLEKETFLPN